MYLQHFQVPWVTPPNVIIIPNRDFRKSPDSGLNLKFAIASLESLPPAVARVYTDASYFEDKDGNYHCGNAAVLVVRNKCYKKQHRYHPSLMIYNAEQRALISALDLIRENSRLPIYPIGPYGRIHVILDTNFLSLPKLCYFANEPVKAEALRYQCLSNIRIPRLR